MKHVSNIKPETLKKRIQSMMEFTDEYSKDVENQHVSISTGNMKTDKLVPSVSLRSVIDCGNCAKCHKLCYDIRNCCLWENVRKTRSRNAAIWQADPERYFREVSGYCKSQIAFRWHIGGDIINTRYLEGMVQVANENKHCSFLVFTKMFKVVNEYLDNHEKPENLQIVFSGWVGQEMDNPHNLPESHPIMPDGSTSAKDGAILCTGNCSECLVHDRGCWKLENGQQVVFPAH